MYEPIDQRVNTHAYSHTHTKERCETDPESESEAACHAMPLTRGESDLYLSASASNFGEMKILLPDSFRI